MQDRVEHFATKRLSIYSKLCEKKIENFCDLAEEEAESESLCYKVMNNLSHKVIGRLETLMSDHTAK